MEHDDEIDWFQIARILERRARRAEAALDKITKHPDCHRLIMQIACEALRGGVEREEG